MFNIKVCLCLLFTTAAIHGEDTSDLDANSLNPAKHTTNNVANNQIIGPEPRQMSTDVQPNRQLPPAYSSYNIPQLYTSNYQPQTPPASPVSPSSSSGSSSSGWFSMFRPGRRSSLTSRLRNLVNSLFFRRETTSPYLGSGSSYSLAYRQPPLGYGSGLANGNYLTVASNRYPSVYGNLQSASMASPSWSNYKQWSTGNSPLLSQLGQSGSSANYAWSSNLGNNANPYSALNAYTGTSGSTGGSSVSGAGNYGGSQSAYQVAASNNYPSAVYMSPYSNQRSSLNYKPNAGYSSLGNAPSASASSSSSSSSGPSSQSSSLLNTGTNKLLTSYSQ